MVAAVGPLRMFGLAEEVSVSPTDLGRNCDVRACSPPPRNLMNETSAVRPFAFL